ncbi:Cbb3-type cytochrome oxidase component FixQ [Halpernia humi]|uniref:Cbb3-type cytochrome oxidase component FixQ n=1 Tax=Halpernia humi TaxID=493375 RepID=A0A1H5UIV9_9FLAO|nr:cbb3-type cytochrome c oxidase subunit 3 [Halpernia humi]SEF74959.1 Cbb3-type cytochrome oxidase component FixQ [Halpernia humi]
MVPQNFKDILSNGEHVGLYQTIAMFIFLACFVGLLVYVFSRSKKHYEEEANAPLQDDIEENDPFFKKN